MSPLPLDRHPGIVFRDGPTGCRAALPGGPGVWEVVQTIRTGKARGDAAVVAAADLLALNRSQVRTALRYYATHPEDIDKRIDATGLAVRIRGDDG